VIADFSQPLECLARDLPALIAAAWAAGYTSHKMVATTEVVFRLYFKSIPPRASQGPRRPSLDYKESPKKPRPARRLNIPDRSYDLPRMKNSHLPC